MEKDSFKRGDSVQSMKQGRRNENRTCEIDYWSLPRFTLIVVNASHCFSQLSTNYHVILQAIYVLVMTGAYLKNIIEK